MILDEIPPNPGGPSDRTLRSLELLMDTSKTAPPTSRIEPFGTSGRIEEDGGRRGVERRQLLLLYFYDVWLQRRMIA